MLRDEVEQYTNLTGEDGWHVPIMKVGAFLDGYNRGLEQEPKTGHWIVEPNCWLRCSECGEHYPHTSIYETKGSNYCPNCGAKMVEPQEREDKE